MDGILLVDKPQGWSSFDVIRKLRRVLDIKKIGHAGTLDPMATGLLVILLGNATKQANQYLKLDKDYDAEITLGANSTTDDAEGELKQLSKRQPTREEIELVLEGFAGEQSQVPPQHSAIKVGGKRAYAIARQGESVQLAARPVNIYQIKLEQYTYPILKITTEVSSGTYIRSLARDIGEALDTGAYLSGLRRTRIGNFSQAHAIDPTDVNARVLSDAIIDISI